jgi:hypothetical protein
MHHVFSDLTNLNINENTLLAGRDTNTSETTSTGENSNTSETTSTGENSNTSEYTNTSKNNTEQTIFSSLEILLDDYHLSLMLNDVPSPEVSYGNDFRIVMTGIEELKDLDVNNSEHYKRINIKPLLKDRNYEVFGSVISKNNLKLENIITSFESYDFNGFSAIMKTLNNTNVDITDCYILWIIIGNPLKLLSSSPRNRELQVYCIKESITLRPSISYYPIKTSCQLSEGYTISVNVYCSTANHEPINVKIDIVGWSECCIYFQIIESNYDNSNLSNSNDSNMISESHDQPEGSTDSSTNIEITICILPFHHEKLNIDNRKGEEYSFGLIGHSLTENTKGM